MKAQEVDGKYYQILQHKIKKVFLDRIY